MATMSTSGLYRWAKLGWNLCCYACRVLSLPRNTHSAPRNRYMKTWRHAENRKYITYRNASRWEPSQGHVQHAQNIGDVRLCGFGVMQADRQTNRQINRQSHHNISHPYGSTAHHVYSSAAMEHDKHIVCQLYSWYGWCLHSLWKDLRYMFQSV